MTPMMPDIASKLKASVSMFCTQSIRPVVDTDKVVWNSKIRRNELYYRGLQDLAYSSAPGGLVQYISASTSQAPNSPLQLSASGLGQNLFDYVLNFLQGDVDTFIAVIGARAPNGQAQARDLSNEREVRMKLKADRVNAYLDSHWDVPLLHQQLVRGIGLYGTMFGHTSYTVNKRRYGTRKEPRMQESLVPLGPAFYQCRICGTETEATQAEGMAAQSRSPMPVCQKCGNQLGPETLVQPDSMISLVQNGFDEYENGAVEATIYNPAHITTAFFAPKGLQSAPWLICESEDNKGALIQAYPELREKAYQESYMLDATSTSAMGRYTRQLLTSPTGISVPRSKGQWLHTRIWLTPDTYEYLPGDQQGNIRQYLTESYPDGLMAPMVNGDLMVGDVSKGTPSRVMNERLTSVWAMCKPKASEMIYADPYFECMIQMQDTVNDVITMLIEQAERANPFVIADPEVLDPNIIRRYSGSPGEFKWAKAGSAGSLDKAFFRVPAAELNDTLIAFVDKCVAWCREITGIQPSLFGGVQGGGEKTAREVEIQRNQAMMKLNVPWTNLRHFWATMRENGIYQAAKYSGGTLLTANQQGTLEQMQVDGIWELNQGGWYMKTEESTPESIGQRRDWINNTLTLAPEVQDKVFGITDPGNIEKIQEANGMSDWVIPGYRQVQRLKVILGQLAAAQPIQQPPPPMPPQDPMMPPQPPPPPLPPQPSIPFEQRLFDPQLALKTTQDYLLDDSRQGMEMTNQGGYQNIMAFLDQIHAAMPPPPSPMKWSGNMDFSTLTAAMQQAIAQAEGITVPGVQPGEPLAMPKAPPMRPGAPLAAGQPGDLPPNPMAEAPPQGSLPPPDQSAQAPLPPGVLQ